MHTRKTQKVFTSKDVNEAGVITAVEFTTDSDLEVEIFGKFGEELMERIRQGIDQWVLNTKEGRDAWHKSRGALNIGDLLDHYEAIPDENNPGLSYYLSKYAAVINITSETFSVDNSEDIDKPLTNNSEAIELGQMLHEIMERGNPRKLTFNDLIEAVRMNKDTHPQLEEVLIQYDQYPEDYKLRSLSGWAQQVDLLLRNT